MARGSIIRSVSISNTFPAIYNLARNVLAMYVGVILNINAEYFSLFSWMHSGKVLLMRTAKNLSSLSNGGFPAKIRFLI